ncbi:translation initiation factor IF-2 [Patescibacteria group bacterium]|nr:translation initiation factor IF-2 [Patescibacteria group bacterium]MBU1683568.1 translation initiation factor IF-2 [Patescibacteria group bacterium]MBU1934615.1 translation initiation factor IF-2 [Patescibacteria group bacterium]
MHLNEIARELRITTQELRRELAKTNFGISPTAHEIEDPLASGIMRFLKGKVKPTLKARRVTVIDKDGKEKKEKKPVEESAEVETQDFTSQEEKAEKKEKKRKEAFTIVKKGEEIKEEAKEIEKKYKEEKEKGKADRSHVPKNAPSAKVDESAAVAVSRRIELGTKGEKADVERLPKTYYKSKKKKKKGKREQEDRVLETMQRHPGRKIKIAKVSYEDKDVDKISAEEIAIEKEMDREAFRSQKKQRAVGQKRGTKAQPQIKAKTGVIEIPSIISVKELSEKCGLPVADVIASLLKNGIMATINQKLDYDTAEIIAAELDMEVKKKEEEATTEDLLEGDMKKLLEDEKGKLKTRPPIISIMGHVDHGKTKLLDYIRKANVVATEAGGITQHIGAYQVEKNGHLITFLDTPGHEAFTSMRARGAKATDIAILVVAADEGVKPQTVEAINHAKEAGIPIIVAINKIDKPNANLDRVKGELTEHGLQSEDWGGKDIMVPVSAITGEGIDTLLEMILIVAEMEDLKANPSRMAVGTVIESHLDKSLGPIATILVNTGTLIVGDNIVVGTSIGRIKAMHDHKGKLLKKVPPSGAARISGLEKVPQAGDILQAFKSEKIAKARAEELKGLMRDKEENMSGSMVERIVSQINTGEMKFLKIVLKADTKGSLEAIMQALHKIKSEDVAVKVIHFGVGNISDTDVVMASASQALLVGFHVSASVHIKKLAEKQHVDIKDYTIIYKLIEDVKAILSGMMAPEINVIELGTIEIQEIFLNKKKWVIAGGKVKKGKAESNSMVRVMRGDELLFETELESLKHVKEDVSELEKGSECGIKIKTPKPVQPGDILEVFKIEKIERNIE